MLALMLAHRWMSLPWLAAAGLLMALWPHSITINSYILSESWVGFLTVAGLAWTGRALDNESLPWAMGGTAILALAALSNAALVPLVPLCVAWLLACRRVDRRTALALLVVPVLLCSAWQIRGVLLPPSTSSTSGRALINLDQGSWPDYHAAYQAHFRGDAGATRTLREINRETALLQDAPSRGVGAMLDRMAKEPVRYAAWYASKPSLLWDWSIRMGQGDIYVYPTRFSPFVEQPVLRAVASVCRTLNPLLFMGMAVAWILVFFRRRHLPLSLQWTGLAAIYVTLVYTVLQAEPRYSIPFRPLEILLVTWAAGSIARAVSRRLHAARNPA